MIKEAILKVANHENLAYADAEKVMDEIMTGQATGIQMSSLLTAMSMKGETVDEITAFAAGMRKYSVKPLHSPNALEIVGTGGDRSDSFNISTTSSFVISAAGVPVAKHGNRAASSKCGAADVLEALGVNISMSPEKCVDLLDEIGICFFFAQKYHSAMKYVAPVRRELGIRTVFNVLGPLTNPMGANMQLMGVYDGSLVGPLARVMHNLGVRDGMVVHGHDGLDEISINDRTSVCEIRDGKFADYEIDPDKFGFERCGKEDIRGGGPKDNAVILREVLGGERGPHRDIVVLNSAAALYVAKKSGTIEDAIGRAEEAIDSGSAMERLERFIEMSNAGDASP